MQAPNSLRALPRSFAVLAVASAPLAHAQAPADAPDEAPRVMARALAEEAPLFASGGGALAPRVLFRAAGDANAYAIADAGDANGDLVRDVAVGFGLGKSGDNLEVWSGAGFGLGERLWGLVTADGISGGYFGDVDQITAFPDVDGDGREELLAGTWGGGRAATLYSGADGTVLQSFDTYLGPASGWIYAVAVLGDVDADGVADFAVAAGSSADAVWAVSGAKTGVHHDYLWKFSAPDVVYSLAIVGDVDGDGHRDLVAGTGDNAKDVVLLSARTGAELWRRTLSGSVQHVAAFPDVDADGRDEVVVAAWASGAGVVLLDGTTGAVRWVSGEAGSNAQRVVALGDVDGDGISDVGVGSWQDDARALSGADGSTLWTAPTGGDVWAVEAVPDVDADGRAELAFGSFDGFARLASGASGRVLWTHPANGKKVLAVRALVDRDGDLGPEVLFGAQQLASGVEPLVHVVSARTGPLGFGYELSAPDHVAIGSPLDLECWGPPVAIGALFLVGSAPTLIPLPGLGALAVLPPTFLAPAPVVLPSGHDTVTLPVPADPALVGVELHLQSVALTALPAAPVLLSNRVGFAIGS